VTRSRRRPLLDGSTSRTLILLGSLASVSLLAWHGTVSGEAYTGVIGIIIGGVVHASGTNQGSQATADPPPDVG
jgi:hypothetical protein